MPSALSSTSLTSYKQELSRLRESLSEMLPAAALATFDADAEQLQLTHADVLKVSPGEAATDFTLPDAYGRPFRLREQLARGPVILVFYRGAWSPYCNLQLSQYQRALPTIRQKGAQVVAISPQSPDASRDMAGRDSLVFPVLTDRGSVVARAYTTVFRNGDLPVATMTELGLDFDAFYEDDSRELPVPAAIVVGADGKVRYARTEGGDYRNRPEIAGVLSVL